MFIEAANPNGLSALTMALSLELELVCLHCDICCKQSTKFHGCTNQGTLWHWQISINININDEAIHRVNAVPNV